ncbi:MAG: signal peptide peptidase SppA [Candidatus Cloacimonetes bacterium]|nr:signal peptide peptidase SppA [Candidatus Cloacimonadota bacterium]
MKKLIILGLILLTGISTLYAFDYTYFPTATTDDFLATKVNPAALAFGNASGVGYVHSFQDKMMQKNWALFLNLHELGYCYEKMDSTEQHTLSEGMKLAKNFYFGTDYVWKPAGFWKGDWGLYILARPWDFLSVSGSWRNISRDNESYTIGTGLRPIRVKGRFCYKITLTCDVTYTDSKWRKPIAGVQSQFLDGVHLNGFYDFENEGISVGVGFDIAHFKTGAQYTDKSKSGIVYGNVSDKRYHSFLIHDKQNKFYNYKLSGPIYDVKPAQRFGPFEIVTSVGSTMEEVIEKIETLKYDDRIEGIVFQSGNIYAGLAKFQELQAAFIDFKSTGKKIIFYYDYIMNSNYVFSASVADKIYLNPGGFLDLRGLSVSAPYLKDLLDTLGIDVISFRSHDYKNAANMFTETHMTEAEREMYEDFLSDIYDQMVLMIAEGRGMSDEQVRTAIDNGPYLIAQRALDAGLVDGLIYRDQLKDALKDLYGDVSITGIYRIPENRLDWSDDPASKIAVIYATGNIHSGKNEPGKSIGDETYMKAIEQAREDPCIMGIILRIDSGGGSSLASENIYREVVLCKEGEFSKPVVSSFSGVAASGGYYIACPSDKIFAEPTTITGSIGVIGAVPNLTRLYKKIHINWDVVKEGRNADFASTSRPMNDEEKKMIMEMIEVEYKDFVGKVAQCRGMTFEQVDEIAKGRVWAGTSGLQNGLVDAFGGMKEAVEEVKKLAGIKNDVELVAYPQRKSAFSLSLDMNTPGVNMNDLPVEVQMLIEKIQESTFYDKEHILLLMPYVLPDILEQHSFQR